MSGDRCSRRYDIVAETRRRWSKSEKEAVAAEAAARDVNVSAIARRHGISPSLLFRWIKVHGPRPGEPAKAAQFQYLSDLHQFTGRGSYVYDKIWSFTGGYFNVHGSADAGLYPDAESDSPNSSGWTADVAWLPWSKGGPSDWPWLNTRIGVLYTHYDEFDGGSTNASDNDTTYLYAWTAF